MNVPGMMNCVVLDGAGGPEVLVPAKRPVPVPGPGEVLIKVAAAGLNYSDTSKRAGRSPWEARDLSYDAPERKVAPKLLPGQAEIIGLEVAGTIAAVGPGVSSPQIGDPVCALMRNGGYAEYAVTAAPICLPVPPGFTMAEAAAMPETFFTVWDSVFIRGRFAPGERILVHGGSSGIGTTTIMLAHAFGAQRIFATVRDEVKAQVCRELGCDTPVIYTEEDFVDVITRETGGEGIDLVYDMVGARYFNRNLKCLRMEGRHISVATISGSKTNFDIREVMGKHLTISGSGLGDRTVAQKKMIADELRAKVWPRLGGESPIRPKIHATFPLAKAAEAHRIMDASDHAGKLVLTM